MASDEEKRDILDELEEIKVLLNRRRRKTPKNILGDDKAVSYTHLTLPTILLV